MQGDCCAACLSDVTCAAWVYEPDAVNPNCWPLSDAGGSKATPDRVLGTVGNGGGAQFNVNAQDLYGFFHGLDYVGALGEYTQVRTYCACMWACV